MTDYHDQQPTVLVLDFGAQYAQLIARRVREARVYSEIVPHDISLEEIQRRQPAALILSGGPASVYAPDAPKMDARIYEAGIPILGFCYGMQLMALDLGGQVPHTDIGEYGFAELVVMEPECRLLDGVPESSQCWMSHRDSVGSPPDGFLVTARTTVTPVAAMEDPERKLYATQFHPEVAHTAFGQQIIKTFLHDIAGIPPVWTMLNIIDETVGRVREQVGDGRVICALSGGVDSSVVAALLHRAIGDQLTCVFVDHGLLRLDEADQVVRTFRDQFQIDLVHVEAEERYLSLLEGVTDPEQKRRIIGEEFWKVFFEEATKLEGVAWLAQGTLYPDVIESGNKTAAKIKSHHNLIPFPEGVHFDLIEPLKALFKDEVRAVGSELGLPDEIVHRQPFPGPGLAVRIIGAITREKLDTLRAADAIVREEIGAWDVDRSVWQYFAVLPDIRSVGVMGDERTYGHPIIVRAVASADAMTADWARLPHDLLARMSNRIINEVEGINRVAYDITSKPPGTIEWE
ncbi:glutamine-hydrolyzing GMP synthase [Anaerosoma tenue]|uniref:glutamine-hydrolyzing GMP synthase n=1 Tax=Anaerosoma tenue TaxID=2933588 RepID=UPI0022610126|nr:glutamine-hydrolyzing GMP synthase [Anaerosoma tenue]MCK8115580.1 glutamine-hydrolyzing GMP synthase [Anaerosoma tenue]